MSRWDTPPPPLLDDEIDGDLDDDIRPHHEILKSVIGVSAGHSSNSRKIHEIRKSAIGVSARHTSVVKDAP